MEFSLFYFANDTGGGDDGGGIYRLLLAGARFADRHGFRAVWMPERHFHPFGGIYPNPATTAAALATITERVRLRGGSVVAPLHDPIRIAEEWSVVDNLSGGRVGISFAPGWHTTDFVLAPDRFTDRKAHVVTALSTVRALWRGEEVTATDGTGAPQAVRLYPRPVQPDLPAWLTTSGNPESYELAGRLGTNVLTHAASQDHETLRHRTSRYREVLAAHHPGGRGHVTLMLHTFLGHDLDVVRAQVAEPLTRYLRGSFDLRMRTPAKRAAHPEALGEREIGLALRRATDRYFQTAGLFGPPERCVEIVERFAESGVDEIGCLIDYGPDLAATMASLELLAPLCERMSAP